MQITFVSQWQTHIKFNGRAPRTLEELAIARADYEHGRRLAEVKKLAPKLALLAPFLPALAEAGADIARREFSLYKDGNGLAIRVMSEVMSGDNKLFDALLALGFREVDRYRWAGDRGDAMVTLKHGRALLVKIDVRSAVASPVAAESQRTPATHT